MFVIEGIVSGIIATLLFDLFQISLTFAYGINKAKWDLAGRYFIGISRGTFIQEDLSNEPVERNELFIGYTIHYLIGAFYGLIYVIINSLLLGEPSLILALIIGFLTVLGSWCLMMPYAYNSGFFASKKEEQKQILVQNLLFHFVFGVGLFLGYVIMP